MKLLSLVTQQRSKTGNTATGTSNVVKESSLSSEDDDSATISSSESNSDCEKTQSSSSTSVAAGKIVCDGAANQTFGSIDSCDLHNLCSVLSSSRNIHRKDDAMVITAADDEIETAQEAKEISFEEHEQTTLMPPSLEEQREHLLLSAGKLLRERGFSIRQQLQALLKEESATLIQSTLRGWIARTRYQTQLATHKVEMATLTIQANLRGFVARTQYQERVAAAKFIQLYFREYQYQKFMRENKEFIRIRETDAAHCIQYYVQNYMNCRIGAAIMIQATVRRLLVQNRVMDTEYDIREESKSMFQMKHDDTEMDDDDDDEGELSLLDEDTELDDDHTFDEEETLHTYDEETRDQDAPIDELEDDDHTFDEEGNFHTYEKLEGSRANNRWFDGALNDIVLEMEDTWKEWTV